MAQPGQPPSLEEQARFELIMKHGHKDLVQAVAFNAYGDRCATGAVDGKIRVFNRHSDGVWHLCDSWGAHSGEILELQWLPPTIYPNLLASLGVEGRFKLWAEDTAAAPGRRFSFSQRAKTGAKSSSSSSSSSNPPTTAAAYESRSPRAPYRSFSLKHNDETRHTHLALLAADGALTVLQNEQPEDLSVWAAVDELRVCPRPARGEEASFRVRFDPNPDPCYAALRAGVRPDALTLVVAAMGSVAVYRSRPVATAAYGLQADTAGRAFYKAAEIRGHRGLVRDVAWAPGNFRGYDILATACQDGFVRVVRLDTPLSPPSAASPAAAAATPPAPSWSVADITKHAADGRPAKAPKSTKPSSGLAAARAAAAADAAAASARASAAAGTGPSGHVAADSALSVADLADDVAVLGLDGHAAGPASAATSAATSLANLPDAADPAAAAGAAAADASAAERRWTGEPGQVRHVVRELSRLENHRTPVWRVAFDDDGQILGSVGDDGKLLCYRQTPDGSWARSSEMTIMKARMAAS